MQYIDPGIRGMIQYIDSLIKMIRNYVKIIMVFCAAFPSGRLPWPSSSSSTWSSSTSSWCSSRSSWSPSGAARRALIQAPRGYHHSRPFAPGELLTTRTTSHTFSIIFFQLFSLFVGSNIIIHFQIFFSKKFQFMPLSCWPLAQRPIHYFFNFSLCRFQYILNYFFWTFFSLCLFLYILNYLFMTVLIHHSQLFLFLICKTYNFFCHLLTTILLYPSCRMILWY